MARILATHVVAGLHAEAGGPAYSVPRLAESLGQLDCTIRIRCLGREEVVERSSNFYKFTHRTMGWGAGKLLGVSNSLYMALQADALEGAIIHSHGLWLMPNLYPSWVRRRFGAPIVCSIRGMLGPAALAISSWKKKPMWMLAQRDALKEADCLHATAESELQEIRKMGLRNPVAVLPNGIDVTSKPVDRRRALERNILYLGRVHPKKGLIQLIMAWHRIEASIENWNLRIVGPSELGHAEELRREVSRLGCSRITIEPGVFGPAKEVLFGESDICILPTLNENFGIAVAEALAVGLPVICTKGAPWGGLRTERCGWWIDHGVDSIASALLDAVGLNPEERYAMGQRGREWMRKDFSWNTIALEMQRVYAWLLGAAPRPSVVDVYLGQK